MTVSLGTPDDDVMCYWYVKRGDCGCCGSPLGESSLFADVPIAEMIVMCGHCVDRGHAVPETINDIMKNVLYGVKKYGPVNTPTI